MIEKDGSPPLWWVEMGYLGKIDPKTELLRSYDTGKQQVGQQFFSLWDFWFDLEAALGQTIQGSVFTGSGYSATLNVHIDENTIVGPLTGPYSRPFRSGRYYVKVTTSVGPTYFHFGIVAVPPLSLFPNDAGRTSAAPRDLGTLTGFLGRSNSFYTYFPRARVSESSGPGPLLPDFNQPTPWAPSPDWYRFRLANPRRVRLTASGTLPAPTFVVHWQDGRTSIWSGGQTVDLQAGPYLLSVYDQKTQVAGGGSGELVIIRNPRAENFSHYQFELSVSP